MIGLFQRIMILRNYGITDDVTWTFDDPVACFFLYETTIVANPVDDFAESIFSSCNAEYFISLHPQHNSAFTFRAIAMSIYRINIPNPALETKCSIGKSTNRAK